MPRRRLLWHLYPSYLLITLVALAAVLWYGSDVLQTFQRSQTRDALEARARLAEKDVAALLSAGNEGAVNALCADLRARGDARFTVIRPDGLVLGESDEVLTKMGNHADRPEVIEALDGRTGVSVRPSGTLQRDMMYVAVPVRNGERIVGVVRPEAVGARR